MTPSSSRGRPRSVLGSLVSALKLEGKESDYSQVSSEEDGGIFAYRGDEDGLNALASHSLLGHGEKLPSKPRNLCFCCGINWTFPMKVFGILAVVIYLWLSVKLILWAVVEDSPMSELTPTFGASLACASAPFIYNSSAVSISVPVGQRFEHAVDIRGGAVGTILLVQAKDNVPEVRYEVTIRSDVQDILDEVQIYYSKSKEERSMLTIYTPYIAPGLACMRYDITVYIPPALKKFGLGPHTPTHVKFDPKSHFELDDLFVTLYAMSKQNLIISTEDVSATHLSLEVFRGWITGEVSIVDSTSINTQRGDGVIDVSVLPAPSSKTPPATAILRSATGKGRTDITYINKKAYPHRPISSSHLSARNGELFLTYRDAKFNGLVDLEANDYAAKGLQGDENTYWVGNKGGGDALSVNSRGRVELTFE